MKKYCVILCLLLVFSFFISGVSYASDCNASFNILTNTLHIPCLEIDETIYWLDLEVNSWNPLILGLRDFGVSTQTITINDLVGTYRLSAFTIKYDYGLTITEKDVSSFSGTMKVYSSGYIEQTITVMGQTVAGSGNMTIIDNNFLRIDSGGCTYTASFSYDGSTFTTTMPTGSCGFNFSETDVWTKISSTTAYDHHSLQEDTNNETIKSGNLGSLIGEALH